MKYAKHFEKKKKEKVSKKISKILDFFFIFLTHL